MIDRRVLLAGLSAALVAPRSACAATVTDAAGRNVAVPAKVARVFPAGPPAAILLYTLAPDLLIGWPRANRVEECVYMLPEICARPEVGRITGRGNTANLETVLAQKPDLILLDIGLPGRDGYEVARLIRAHPALARTTIVALTGYGTEKDREQSKAAGFDEHIIKPVDFARLRELLETLSDRSA